MPTFDMTTEKPQGYWVDLTGFKFDDLISTSWIQAFPLGSYDHPVYGKIDITPERVMRFASNVNLGVRTQELDIDYDHKDNDGKAAGWVKAAEARQDGLWLLIQWTESAHEALKKKEYRYFSPEFVDEWTHPKTGSSFKDVLFGGAITNRPFLKDILPINLTEVAKQFGGNVDELTKALIKALGLPEDAKPEDLLAAVAKLQVPAPSGAGGEPDTPPPTSPPQPKPTPDPQPDEKVPAMLNEQQLMELPQVKALADKVRTLEAANRLAEVNAQVSSLNDGATHAIPPAALESLKTILVDLPKTQGDRVVQMFKETVKQGLIPLGERGSMGGNTTTDSHSKRFSDEVDKLMSKDDKLTYADAVQRIGDTNPELWEGYRREALTKDPV